MAYHQLDTTTLLDAETHVIMDAIADRLSYLFISDTRVTLQDLWVAKKYKDYIASINSSVDLEILYTSADASAQSELNTDPTYTRPVTRSVTKSLTTASTAAITSTTTSTAATLPPTKKQLKSAKYYLFCSEPIKNKTIIEVPGIGPVSAELFNKKGYDSAAILLGQYLLLNRDTTIFIAWLTSEIGISLKLAEDVSDAMTGWWHNNS